MGCCKGLTNMVAKGAVAKGADGAAAGEPKCGSKMLFIILCSVSSLLMLICLGIAFGTKTCLCSGTSGCDKEGGPACTVGWGCNGATQEDCCVWGDETGCMTAGTQTLLILIGILFIVAGSVSICGICACCCFAPEPVVVTQIPVAQAAAPVAAVTPAQPVEEKMQEGVTPAGGYPGATWGEQKNAAIENKDFNEAGRLTKLIEEDEAKRKKFSQLKRELQEATDNDRFEEAASLQRDIDAMQAEMKRK